MASFGETLRREREMREITLREISDATKINIRYLEALEQNRFEILPGGLFNKGFIRAYAGYVGLDAEDMVDAYLDEIAVKDDRGRPAPAPSGIHRPAESPRRREPFGHVARAENASLPATAPPAPHSSTERDGMRDQAPPPRVEAPTASVEESAASPTGGAEPARPTRVLALVFGLIAAVSLVFAVLGVFMPGPPTHPPEPAGDARAGTEPTAAAIDPATTAEPPGEPAVGSGGGPEAARTARVSTVPSGRPATREPAASPGASPDPGGAREPPREAPTEPSVPPAPAAAIIDRPEPMNLRLKTRGRTWVHVFCDGEESINWVMRSGDEEEMTCNESIRVSATDAAAVRLWVNDRSCPPLGEAGQRVYGYTLRIDDYSRACRPRRRGSDER